MVKGQVFVLVEISIIRIDGIEGNRKLGKHHSNNDWRQEPFMAAKIRRQKSDEKQDIWMISEYISPQDVY